MTRSRFKKLLAGLSSLGRSRRLTPELAMNQKLLNALFKPDEAAALAAIKEMHANRMTLDFCFYHGEGDQAKESTPLIAAIERGMDTIVKHLLEMGVDCNVRSKEMDEVVADETAADAAISDSSDNDSSRIRAWRSSASQAGARAVAAYRKAKAWFKDVGEVPTTVSDLEEDAGASGADRTPMRA